MRTTNASLASYLHTETTHDQLSQSHDLPDRKSCSQSAKWQWVHSKFLYTPVGASSSVTELNIKCPVVPLVTATIES